MSHWNWLLDPRLTVIGAAVLTLLGGVYIHFSLHHYWAKNPDIPRFSRNTLVRHYTRNAVVNFVYGTVIVATFLGLWSWTQSFLWTAVIWDGVPFLIIIAIVTLDQASLRKERNPPHVVMFVSLVLLGLPLTLLFSLLWVAYCAIRTIDWENIWYTATTEVYYLGRPARNLVDDGVQMSLNLLARGTNARYLVFSRLFSWLTGVVMQPEYRHIRR